MPRQFFSGNSIEQAVMSAARHYQIEPERLAYKLRDKKHGFLNIRRRVVIEVDPENLETSEEVAPEPTPPAVTETQSAENLTESQESAESEMDTGESARVEGGDEVGDSEDTDSDEADFEGDEPESPSQDDGVSEGDGSSEDSESSEEDEETNEEDSAPDERDEEGEAEEKTSRGERSRGRGGRGRGRRGGEKKRRRDVKIKEFSWDDDEDGWDSDEVEEGDTQELSAVELCVERILDVMDLEIEYTITEGEAMDIEFSGEDSEFLVEDNGKVLKAIEHIVPRMVRGLIGRSISVNADCEGFRADHENSLRDLAEDAAQDVVRKGKPKTLAPMNPADRRIVHLALVDHPDVETVSQGHGFMKRVKILPSG